MVAGKEVTPKDASTTERLMRYWAGPGIVAGLCANLHHRALGVWPGRE